MINPGAQKKLTASDGAAKCLSVFVASRPGCRCTEEPPQLWSENTARGALATHATRDSRVKISMVQELKGLCACSFLWIFDVLCFSCWMLLVWCTGLGEVERIDRLAVLSKIGDAC